jgi:type III restriction enzyme
MRKSVLAKKAAAERFCKYASEYTADNQGKEWKYLILPHNEVSRTVSMNYLATKFK